MSIVTSVPTQGTEHPYSYSSQLLIGQLVYNADGTNQSLKFVGSKIDSGVVISESYVFVVYES